MVAHHCALGAESFMNTAHGQISYETLDEIPEAFLAAYAIASKYAGAFLVNLDRSDKVKRLRRSQRR